MSTRVISTRGVSAHLRQRLIAVGNIAYTHPTLAPAGKTPTGYWEHFIISGISLTEGVFLFGEAGDDLIVGNDGADYLDGGSGMDQLFGHAGNDVLDGGTEGMEWRVAA